MQSLKPAQLAFFSYAHEDAEFALRLAKDLRAGGATVWMDRLDIKPGERWDRAIEDALAKCPQMLVILSPAAVESTNVMDEVSLALEEGKTVLPVIHRNCKIPFRLRRLQHVDLTLNYEAGLGRLLETLGFATPSSEMPVQDVERDLAVSSDRDGGTEEINLLSPAASQEHEATLPMPKKRVFGWVMATIGIVAVLVALGLKFAAITRTKSYQSPMRVAIQPTSTSPAAESKATPGEKVKRLAPPERRVQSPETRDRIAGTGNAPPRFNLLSPENAGQVLVSPSDNWAQTIDGKEDKVTWFRAGQEAVYGFKDEQPATFDTFTTLVTGTVGYGGGNLKEFELLVGNDSPTGDFKSIGKFTVTNAKLPKTPYQEFKFPEVTAKYLKVKILSGYATLIALHEFQLLGKLAPGAEQSESAATPARKRATGTINLLSPPASS
jgi:TIR domain